MKKLTAVVLASLLVMMTGCANTSGNVSHDLTQDLSSDVEDVLAQRMAEADAQAQDEVPGLSDSEDESGRQSGVDEGAPKPDPLALDESVLQTEGVDIDLTVLSSTMVYSQVYNLMVDPYGYIGKTIKMTGMYACTDMTQSTVFYCACIIEDATQCCSQGIEFELDDTYSFPDDYPEYGDNITVIGEFDIYQDGGYTYCTLRNARLVD